MWSTQMPTSPGRATNRYTSSNAAFASAWSRLQAAGVKGLYRVACQDLLGDDGEATVDGTHPTDLGFLRMADAIEPTLRRALQRD